MSTQPYMLSAAGGDLHGIGTAVSVGNAVAAGPMTGVVPAAEEVSALSAAQFAAYAQMYQDFSAQAAAIHEQFVATLATSAASCLPPRPQHGNGWLSGERFEYGFRGPPAAINSAAPQNR
jgi:PE family